VSLALRRHERVYVDQDLDVGLARGRVRDHRSAARVADEDDRAGEKDHTVPWAITNASYRHQHHNKDVTGDSGNAQPRPRPRHRQRVAGVADTALAFVQRFAPGQPTAT
jgi:hypothetical protein